MDGNDGAAPWIEQLYHDRVTKGCAISPLRFCPDSAVTRTQAAVFLLRAIHGKTYTPPPAGVFAEVDVNHWGATWAEQLYAQGITEGCGEDPLRFCPDAPVTRDTIAVLMVRAFELTDP